MKNIFNHSSFAKAFIISFAGICLACSAAMADGGESRKISPAEKKFMETVHAELRASLPKAPAGWSGEAEEARVFEEVAVGFEKFPLTMNVGASYSKNETEAENEAKSKAIAEIGEKNKSAIDMLMKKQDELSVKLAKAAEKMDMKEVEKLQKESEIIAAEAEKINASMTDDMRSSKSGNLLKSTSANASVQINPSEVYITEPSLLPEIGGCIALREKPENADYDDKVKTLILVGPWKVSKKADGGLDIKSPYAEGAAYDKIMCAAVHIDASPDITDLLIKSVDLKKIAALINK
ncbi:MAG TPA: hypothetical protein PK467_04995 [Candidatus Wallbacteria bacterium]|nr:hypothetical protein [Candidatus Wallbacteria bacterium]